jgi:hypothetical protein
MFLLRLSQLAFLCKGWHHINDWGTYTLRLDSIFTVFPFVSIVKCMDRFKYWVKIGLRFRLSSTQELKGVTNKCHHAVSKWGTVKDWWMLATIEHNLCTIVSLQKIGRVTINGYWYDFEVNFWLEHQFKLGRWLKRLRQKLNPEINF